MSERFNLALVAIGDELLQGELVDSNSAFASDKLFRMGVFVKEHRTIPDDTPSIVEHLRALAKTYDVVITSGGLGPTEDDLTAQAAAKLLGVPLVIHEESLARSKAILAKLGVEFKEKNRMQAAIPEGARVTMNPAGLAPAFSFQHEGCLFYCLPGVPREYRAILETGIFAEIQALSAKRSKPHIAYRIVHLLGVPESHLSERMDDIMKAHPEAVFGFRAHYPLVSFKVRVTHDDAEAADRLADEIEQETMRRYGDDCLGTGDETLVGVVGKLLMSGGYKLSTAESCTGGLIGKRLTDASGSSAYYLGGAVVYSNAMKTALLGVAASLIERHGAVSEAVAAAMATGAKERFSSDYAVAVTGIAGPTGGSETKPVGLVHFALAYPGGIDTLHRRLRPDRASVRDAAANIALDMIRRRLLKEA